MTLGAIMVEIIGDVIRICHGVIVAHMAAITIHWRILITVGVTGYTLQSSMRPCQWELSRAVIESRWIPNRCRMTLRAIMIEIIGHMVGIGYRIIITNMAAIAIQRSILIAVGMTGYTLQGNMSTG